MRTFDYAAAWRDVARPAFNALPESVRKLLARVAEECRELHQGPDLAMVWPNDGGELRAAFDAIPDEDLAWGARVIHDTGHWYPGNGRGVELPGREHGAHWKFSHYADQRLRVRVLQRPEADREHGAGLSWAVLEGTLRLCYTSRDMWTWAEVAPGTAAGLARSHELRRQVAAAFEKFPPRQVHERDQAAYQAFENLRGNRTQIDAPPYRWGLFLDLERYMVEDGDQAPDPDAPPVDVEAIRRAAIDDERARVARKIGKLETERDGRIWFLERNIPIDNLIYYDHKPRWCFGWRHPVGPALLSRILDVISEFGQPYEIKTSDGRTLAGNIE